MPAPDGPIVGARPDPARPLTVLVTGGAGFIGSALCRVLAARPGTSIRVLDDLSAGRRENLTGVDVTLIEGSVLDPGALASAIDGVDAVVHLAAVASVQESLERPLHVHEVNVTGTVAVLEAARAAGLVHTIVASSSAVYGSLPDLPKNERMRPRTESPYGATKLAAETYALTWQRSFGLPVLAFRFFNVFGPRQRADAAYPAVVPAFLERAVAGEAVTVHGTGEQSRDFTYVESICAVIADAIARGVAHDEPVDLGFGVRTSLLELIAEIEDVLGHPVPVAFEAARVGDILHSQAEGSVLASLFPGVPAVQLREGLEATVAWMRDR
ncbi:NAD-dependent epimerase/dehydratase family protein [Herbiconiux sp.]|uniref:NAD-dependent epimerase/dehydratase family protein n=1 Tax=Herbiconiux sp. TaxID=1871186 RepID=UPI0025C684D4|nr:NAD-dependent epimerase/dehydratase family protein [Herbiconiux sp.]